MMTLIFRGISPNSCLCVSPAVVWLLTSVCVSSSDDLVTDVCPCGLQLWPRYWCLCVSSSCHLVTDVCVFLCSGRSVEDDTTVPVHRLARTGHPQVRGRLHWLHWSSAQDQGAVWAGWTHHRPLQVGHSKVKNQWTGVKKVVHCWNLDVLFKILGAALS